MGLEGPLAAFSVDGAIFKTHRKWRNQELKPAKGYDMDGPPIFRHRVYTPVAPVLRPGDRHFYTYPQAPRHARAPAGMLTSLIICTWYLGWYFVLP